MKKQLVLVDIVIGLVVAFLILGIVFLEIQDAVAAPFGKWMVVSLFAAIILVSGCHAAAAVWQGSREAAVIRASVWGSIFALAIIIPTWGHLWLRI
jgi:hypothetical protein